MWQAPARPPNQFLVIVTGCIALLLAVGGHHWIVGSILAATMVLIGMIRDANWPIQTKGTALIWSLFFGGLTLCIFLVGFNRPGIGFHGWRLANTIGVISLSVLMRKTLQGLCRQVMTNTPVQIRVR